MRLLDRLRDHLLAWPDPEVAWLPDPDDPRIERLFAGEKFTEQTRPKPS